MSNLYKGRETWLQTLPPNFAIERNEVAARALVVHEGRVLLVYHSNTEAWLTPGGRIAPGEPMPEALAREMVEEVGIDVEIGDLAGFFDVLMPKQRSHKFEFLFICRPKTAPDWLEKDCVDGDPTGVVTKARWFTPEEAAALPRVFPSFIRNWPELLAPRPRAYYGTRLEEGHNEITNMQRFYISSRVVTTHDNKLLMVYRRKGDFWYGPGGQIELGEQLADCAAREVQEETGLVATASDVIAVDEFFAPSFGNHQINIYTRCELKHGELDANWRDTVGEEHVNKSAFFSEAELAALPRAYPAYMAELAWPLSRMEIDNVDATK